MAFVGMGGETYEQFVNRWAAQSTKWKPQYPGQSYLSWYRAKYGTYDPLAWPRKILADPLNNYSQAENTLTHWEAIYLLKKYLPLLEQDPLGNRQWFRPVGAFLGVLGKISNRPLSESLVPPQPETGDQMVAWYRRIQNKVYNLFLQDPFKYASIYMYALKWKEGDPLYGPAGPDAERAVTIFQNTIRNLIYNDPDRIIREWDSWDQQAKRLYYGVAEQIMRMHPEMIPVLQHIDRGIRKIPVQKKVLGH